MSAVKTALKAKDIMVLEPVCVDQTTTIRELARLFEENEISGAPVIDVQGRVVGIVSKTDLIRRCMAGTTEIPPAALFEMLSEQGGEAAELIPETRVSVEDLMTEAPSTVKANTPAGEVAHLMCEGRFHRIVVVDDEKFPLGIITSLDLLRTYPK